MVDPADDRRRATFADGTDATDLLVPILRRGEPACDLPSIGQIRKRTREQLTQFHPHYRRFVHPQAYRVGLEFGLHQRKSHAILKERELTT